MVRVEAAARMAPLAATQEAEEGMVAARVAAALVGRMAVGVTVRASLVMADEAGSVAVPPGTASPADGAYRIFVKTPSTIMLWVTASESVFSVKTKVAEKAGFPPGLQRLIYSGHQLEDDKLLSDFSVAKEATLHLALRVSTCCMPALAPAQEPQP